MTKKDLEAIRHNYKMFQDLKSLLDQLKPHCIDSLVNIEHGIMERIDFYGEKWCEEVKEHYREKSEKKLP